MTEERAGPGSSVAKSVIQMKFVIYMQSILVHKKPRENENEFQRLDCIHARATKLGRLNFSSL